MAKEVATHQPLLTLVDSPEKPSQKIPLLRVRTGRAGTYFRMLDGTLAFVKPESIISLPATEFIIRADVWAACSDAVELRRASAQLLESAKLSKDESMTYNLKAAAAKLEKQATLIELREFTPAPEKDWTE